MCVLSPYSVRISYLTGHPQTGFEFKKRRAFPVVIGIVIAAENEPVLLEVRRCPRVPYSPTCVLTVIDDHR